MVRPVPIVTIDFGDGTVLNRTLHGNVATYVATYVCNNAGQVLDILPGMYEPGTFLEKLEQLNLLYYFMSAQTNKLNQLIKYHAQRSFALEQGKYPGRFVRAAGKPIAKYPRVEWTDQRPSDQDQALWNEATKQSAGTSLKTPEELAGWQAIVQDTMTSENKLRHVIHEKLAVTPLPKPAAMTKWLFKEVLEADLDDPYLGLGKTLFPLYPFSKEDEQPPH